MTWTAVGILNEILVLVLMQWLKYQGIVLGVGFSKSASVVKSSSVIGEN